MTQVSTTIRDDRNRFAIRRSGVRSPCGPPTYETIPLRGRCRGGRSAAYLAAAILALGFTAAPAIAQTGAAIVPPPGRLSAKSVSSHCRLGQSTQCWVPRVTYRENLTGLDQDTPVYITRIVQLLDGEHDFEARADAQAYVEAVLLQKGFWIDHWQICDGDGVKCLLIPPSAIDSVQLVQVVHPPH